MGLMAITESGKVALAKSIYGQPIHLAWGDLPPFLPSPTGLSLVQIVGTMSAGTVYYVVTATNSNGETLASAQVWTTVINGQGVRVTWDPVLGALSYNVYIKVGLVFKFLATSSVAFYDDTGSISPTATEPPVANTTSVTPWTTTPLPTSINASKLFNEIGRRRVNLKKYVTPDVAGEFVTSQGRFTESLTPTKYLYLSTTYELTDSAYATIYQRSIFVGTVETLGNENVFFLLPNQILDSGYMISYENIVPDYRNGSTREVHEVVLTF